MRIGAPVFGYTTPREWAGLHRERGYTAAYWPLELDAGPREEEAYVQAAGDAGLVIAEVGAWRNTLEDDPRTREANIAYVIARLRQAERVGARCCVNIAGSRAAKWDGPHPLNLAEETFDRVVETTRRIIDEADVSATAFTLEAMPWMFPHDGDSTQRLLEAVGRPGLGVHVDMVNMVNAYEKAYRTGALAEAYFQRFGPHIRSVHAKDFILSDALTLHIDEALPGRGIFDFDALLRACATLPDLPVMAEHLGGDAEYREACAFLRGRCEALGIAL